MLNLKYSQNLLVKILSFRFIILIFTWIYARNSFVFTISVELRTTLVGTRSFTLGLIFMIIRVILIFIIEILFTTDLTNEEVIIDETTWKRIINSNIILLLAEIMMSVMLLLELESDLLSINFVRSIITTASMFSILMNPSGYVFLFWIMILTYIIGMLYYIYPRENDELQKSPESSALMLFLRSIILPI